MARKIVIEVSGGNIQGIYAELGDDSIEISVIDWDNINNGETEIISPYPTMNLHPYQIYGIINDANEKIIKNQEDANT